VIGAKFFDQGKQADDHGPPATITMPRKKIAPMMNASIETGEDKSVGARL